MLNNQCSIFNFQVASELKTPLKIEQLIIEYFIVKDLAIGMTVTPKEPETGNYKPEPKD
jgi:hypothetical protein